MTWDNGGATDSTPRCPTHDRPLTDRRISGWNDTSAAPAFEDTATGMANDGFGGEDLRTVSFWLSRSQGSDSGAQVGDFGGGFDGGAADGGAGGGDGACRK